MGVIVQMIGFPQQVQRADLLWGTRPHIFRSITRVGQGRPPAFSLDALSAGAYYLDSSAVWHD